MHFKGESQQHFSLRKLTIGVASVIIGTTFMFLVVMLFMQMI
ncbi:YSIRK-type signal peptide-containing protein [Lactobacillus crispatus]|nr:YSIRK-type signal peptide-containing protein [Lactobacillus crispatus]